MLAFAEKLHDELLRELDNQERERDLNPFEPDRRPALIQAAMDRLKEKLKSDPFAGKADEICFFKERLPLFLSLLFYYTEKFKWESAGLLEAPQHRIEYTGRLILRIEDFYKDNAEFLRYYRSGRTDFDEHYFLRNSDLQQGNTDMLTAVMDPSFCTLYSFKAGVMLAWSRIQGEDYFARTGRKEEGMPPAKRGGKLQWTDSHVSLVELGYSLKAAGSVNNGKASLSDILNGLSNTFSITLSNPYRIFQEILCRKTGYTNFLDRLKLMFNRFIDGLESRNMR